MLNPSALSAVEAWLKRRIRQDAVLVAIVLIFFAGMLPLAASRIVDSMNFERYYTDAAVSMLETGNFATPVRGDGALRLHKPLPIYWLLIGSYKLMGISFFSSRIWFLVAGCATIWLAHALALKLTADIRVARTTALILLSNVLLITVSARSTQDILITFWLLISAYGFIRLICFNETNAWAYWCAYGAAAMGIATKGFLPVAFVIYALAFAYFTASPRQPFRRMLHPGIIVVSILISCSGLLLLVWRHGPLVLQRFWNDQLGEKIGLAGSPWRVGAYFLLYVPFFLPWLLCLAYLFYKRKPDKPLTDIQQVACRFILIWAALFPIIFGLGDRIQDRYLVPAVPLLAIVMAIGLCRFSNSSIAAVANPLLNVVTIAFATIGIFGVVVLYENGVLAKHFAGLTVAFLTFLLIALRSRRKQFSSLAVLSISLFLILPLCLAILSPFTLPDQTAQVARALQTLNPDKKPVFVLGTNKLASRLRISTGGEYAIHQAKRSHVLKAHAGLSSSIFVLTEGEARRLPVGPVQLQEIAAYPIRVSMRKLFRATLKGDSKAYIESRKVHCYAVVSGLTMSMDTRNN